MKIFFAGSIRGGRQLIPRYHIYPLPEIQNYTVISEHVAAEGLEKVEATTTEQEIYEKDATWVEESDCVVAEITVPSIGVGYEICHAAKHKKPVLCLYETGANASAMVLGNTTGYVSAKAYSNKEQLEEIILEFLIRKNRFWLLLQGISTANKNINAKYFPTATFIRKGPTTISVSVDEYKISLQNIDHFIYFCNNFSLITSASEFRTETNSSSQKMKLMNDDIYFAGSSVVVERYYQWRPCSAGGEIKVTGTINVGLLRLEVHNRHGKCHG